ncbi:hypothetical protein cyc_04403 [Cyclospora cayetanensis]|uniref:Uncharacterized protein n=1 Tax=Cyclospora cayetanensis TaxID=88456 RepID=A0A1D3CSK7_9EIME|nr:hypothetical protein cyc_04403 [Cyclospora cayetanensis]
MLASLWHILCLFLLVMREHLCLPVNGLLNICDCELLHQRELAKFPRNSRVRKRWSHAIVSQVDFEGSLDDSSSESGVKEAEINGLEAEKEYYKFWDSPKKRYLIKGDPKGYKKLQDTEDYAGDTAPEANAQHAGDSGWP